MISYSLMIKGWMFIISYTETSFQSVVCWVVISNFLFGIGAWNIYSIKMVRTMPFTNLKPSLLSQLYYFIFFIHRLTRSLIIVVVDSPKIQMLFLAFSTLFVNPSQFSVYLILITPEINKKKSLQQATLLIFVFAIDFNLLLVSFDLWFNSFGSFIWHIFNPPDWDYVRA